MARGSKSAAGQPGDNGRSISVDLAPAPGRITAVGHAPTAEALNQLKRELEYLLMNQPAEWRARWGGIIQKAIGACQGGRPCKERLRAGEFLQREAQGRPVTLQIRKAACAYTPCSMDTVTSVIKELGLPVEPRRGKSTNNRLIVD